MKTRRGNTFNSSPFQRNPMTTATQTVELIADIHYTQDIDDISAEGVTCFNDSDFNCMDLYKDGKVAVSCSVRDFIDEKEMVIQPGQSWDEFFTLVKVAFIKEAYEEEWI